MGRFDKIQDNARSEQFDARLGGQIQCTEPPAPAGYLEGLLALVEGHNRDLLEVINRLSRVGDRIFGERPETGNVDKATPSPVGVLGVTNNALGHQSVLLSRLRGELVRIEEL